MSVDLLWPALIRLWLAGTAASALVLVLRTPLKAWLGPRAVYPLWSCVPVCTLAMLMPARTADTMLAPAPMLPLALMPQVLPLSSAAVSARWGVLLAWGFGCAACAIVLMLRQWRYVRDLGDLRPLRERVWQAAGARGVPAVTGLLRPRIVLPRDFAGRYDAAERRLVFAHECVHLRRGDLRAHAVAAALLCLHWFNPLMHVALRRFRDDQEQACDAVVLARRPQLRRRYAEAMLKPSPSGPCAAWACPWSPRHPLQERIAMLKRPVLSRRMLAASRALTVGIVAAVGCAAWTKRPVAAGHAAATPMQAAGVDEQDKMLKPPRYPAAALRRLEGGKVVAVIDVDAQGHAASVHIESSEPAGVFDAAVMEAARRWRFRPAREHGHPVAGRVRVPVHFDTEVPETPAPAGHAGDGYAWYRMGGDLRREDVDCDAVVAASASAAQPLCGIRRTAAR